MGKLTTKLVDIIKSPLKFWLSTGGTLIGLLTCQPTAAQIVPDSTLPNNSVVPPDCIQCQITGGTTAGNNLFHSFEHFTIPTGSDANFNNATPITNIISRVTGNLPSDINGRIRANGTANLFLINPNGIIFGPEAALSIGGSFLATTAYKINFADGTQFSATNPQTTPLLTVSLPVGLQFGQSPGEVTNQSLAPLLDFSTGELVLDNQRLPVLGGLQVAPDRTLALVGGNVTLDSGGLTAPGGRIELGGLSGVGTVRINFEGNSPRLDYPNEVARADVSLTNAARVDASGEGGGNIQVQSRRVQLNDGSQIRNYTQGSRPGGTLSVTATESVELIGVNRTAPTSISAEVTRGATGRGSDITIKTQQLSIQDGARISTATRGSGQGGNLEVNASESVELIGTQTPGTIPLRSALFTTVAVEGVTGDGGNLTVETRRLSIRDGATIDASTFGDGDAGDLTVRASESVDLSGTSADPRLPNNNRLGRSSSVRIETRTNSSNPGDAGNLRIETRQLTIRDSGRVSVSSSLPRSGRTGNLEIAARSIFLDNQGNIQATDEAANQSSIRLGNIRLDSQSLVLRNGSFITTNAQRNATGGNITINTDTLVALENSDINANAQQGSGGRIIIDAQGIFGTEFREQDTLESDITATSDLGPQFSGSVEIITPDVNPSQGIDTLPVATVNASDQIAVGCTNNPSSSQGRFVIAGRGGLPPNPGDPLNSDTVLTNWATLGETEGENISRRATTTSIAENLPTQQIVEAQGWIVDANGKVFLTAQAPKVTPNTNKLNTTSCNG